MALSYKSRSIFRIIAEYWRINSNWFEHYILIKELLLPPHKRSTIWIWVQLLWACGHFELQHWFLVPKNWTTMFCFCSASIPLWDCTISQQSQKLIQPNSFRVEWRKAAEGNGQMPSRLQVEGIAEKVLFWSVLTPQTNNSDTQIPFKSSSYCEMCSLCLAQQISMFDSTRVCSSPQVVPATTGNVPALRGSVSINISQSVHTVHRQDEEQEKKKVHLFAGEKGQTL